MPARPLGNRPLLVRDTPGHARHHFCVWDEPSRGWFSGDTFGVAYRGSSLETVVHSVAEQRQIFRGADHAWLWKPKLLIPDTYESPENHCAFGRFLDTCVRCTTEVQVLAAVRRLAVVQKSFDTLEWKSFDIAHKAAVGFLTNGKLGEVVSPYRPSCRPRQDGRVVSGGAKPPVVARLQRAVSSPPRPPELTDPPPGGNRPGPQRVGESMAAPGAAAALLGGATVLGRDVHTDIELAAEIAQGLPSGSVSYTHLTLPTSDLV